MSSRARTPGRDPLSHFFLPQTPDEGTDTGEVRTIARELIDPNPFQPRKRFEQGALDELASSVREHGVLQPLLVRPLGGRYQIVAGERRWRAAGLAGLAHLPCAVRAVPDDELEVLTLLENIQRADLDPVDEAHAYRRLLDRAGISQRALAARLHKDPEYVAQRLRLIADPQVEQAVRAGLLGPTVGQELARVADPARRRGLLDRAAGGERVTVQEVKHAREAERSGGQQPADSDMPGPWQPDAAGTAVAPTGPGSAALHLLATYSPDVQEQLARLVRLGADAGWSCAELLRQLGL